MASDKSVVITGVSSGIGREAARHFLREGWRVFGSVRKIEDAAGLEDDPDFTPLVFDVTDRAAVDRAARLVKESLDSDILDLLVNNAGIAKYGPLMHIPPEELRENLEVNVMGVLHVSQAFLPLLGAVQGYDGPKGRIINIGSVSGRFVLPLLGPYCASKYALLAISHAMRRELLIHNIDVSLVEPASAESDIWSKARDAETHVRGTAYERIEDMKTQLIDKQEKGALPTQKVVDVIYKAAIAGRPRPRYLVTPNNFINRIVYNLPDRWVDALFKRAFHRANADSVQFWK